MLLIFTVITGVIYPLAVTGVAQVLFPRQANGSLIVISGKTYGSELIGQQFDDPKYFWGRLSATGTFAYNAFNAENLTGSSGSNYGPLNPALVEMVQARIDALKAADPDNTTPDPCRPRHCFRQWAGSAYQCCRSVVPSPSRCTSPRSDGCGGEGSRGQMQRRTSVRLFR